MYLKIMGEQLKKIENQINPIISEEYKQKPKPLHIKYKILGYAVFNLVDHYAVFNSVVRME